MNNSKHLLSIVVTTVLVLVALLALSAIAIATARPIIDHGTNLARYLFGPKPPISPKLEDQLNETVRSRLLNQLPQEMAGRLVFEQVPSWNPLPMDNPSTRMEQLRRVADTVPEPGRDWNDLQGGIRDAYLLFLGALGDYSRKHGNLLAESERQLGEIREKRGDAMQRLNRQRGDSSHRSGGATVRMRAEETVFAWFTAPPDSKVLGRAINDAELTLTPNPQDSYSQFPTLSTPTSDDLAKWFDSDERSQQTPISTVDASSGLLAGSSGTLSAGPQQVSSPQSVGHVVAKLYARDWQVWRLRRSWLTESLLEQYHRDGSFLLDIHWLFNDDGPLARIPIAIVVARDVLYRVQFTDGKDYLVARSALQNGSPLKLSIGATTLVIEPGSARASDVDHTLTIAPASSHAQIVSVVSLRY
jgi:hypothetical protein